MDANQPLALYYAKPFEMPPFATAGHGEPHANRREKSQACLLGLVAFSVRLACFGRCQAPEGRILGWSAGPAATQRAARGQDRRLAGAACHLARAFPFLARQIRRE